MNDNKAVTSRTTAEDQTPPEGLMDDSLLEFTKHVHSNLGEFIRAADQKAGFLLVAATALLGWLMAQGATEWKFWVRLIAILLIGVSGALATLSVLPRQHRLRNGLIAWNGIRNAGSPDQYHTLVLGLKDGGLQETASHSYRLAEILQKKYRLLWGAICAFILGGALTLILVIANIAQHNALSTTASTCEIKAAARGLHVSNHWNPNSIELDYLITNRSTGDYAFQDKFRVMRMTPDGILHTDAGQVALPATRFFPHNHPVDFAVWIDLGNVVDHSPTDSEKIALQKRLDGTDAYVLFDDNQRCEIELPVTHL